VPFLSKVTLNITQFGFTHSATEEGSDAFIHIGKAPNSEKHPSNVQMEYAQGQYQDLASYSSIQNDLPDYYGVGHVNKKALNTGSTTTRQNDEQTDQFKAYLTLFDQILCDYFAQLDNASSLLSMIKSPPLANSQPCLLQELPADILPSDQQDFYIKFKRQNDELNAHLKKKNWQHKNSLLDHLLAMFGETYMPLLAYKCIKNEIVANSDSCSNQEHEANYLEAKQDYLNQIVPLQAERFHLSALEKMIALKLGLQQGQASIKDLTAGQSFPIAYAQIESKKLECKFKVSNPSEWLYRINIKLPDAFDESKNPNLYQYACQMLDEVVPAHIVYSIEYQGSQA